MCTIIIIIFITVHIHVIIKNFNWVCMVYCCFTCYYPTMYSGTSILRTRWDQQWLSVIRGGVLFSEVANTQKDRKVVVYGKIILSFVQRF